MGIEANVLLVDPERLGNDLGINGRVNLPNLETLGGWEG
jgi:hypothetical protein